LVLTALLLFCCNTFSGDTPRTSPNPHAADTKVTTNVALVAAEPAKPDAPTPKAGIFSASRTGLEVGSGGELGGLSAPAIQPALSSPVKPATTESYETPRQREIWYALMVADHSTAAFDAWTTRRAVGGGYGVEGDPLQRPFAHSGAIYVTTQVTPVLMDYLGHRMMRSDNPWIRKAWWVPQAASTSVSLGAAVHNYNLVP
jgi:hypothetical protein